MANLLANLARDLGTDDADSTIAGLLARRSHPLVDDLPAPRALVFDQFEELFTLYPERWAQRSEVVEQIRDALEQDPLLRVVLAVREDFIAQLDPHAALFPAGLRARMRLEPLRRPAALEAVTGPLRSEQRTFAPGVAERLVDDLLTVRVHTMRDESVEVPGEVVEPVQLQVVCRTLWSSLLPEVREIGEEDLARIGTVSDVLSNYFREAVHAAAIAGSIKEVELRERLEEAFITPVGTRGTVVGGAERTAGMPNAAIAELEARHLVRAEWRAGARWFELTHDSLIRPIRSSNAAVRERRRDRRERTLKQAIAGLAVLALLLVGLLSLGGGRDGEAARAGGTGVLDAKGPLAGLRLARAFVASTGPVGVRTVAGGRGLVVASADGRIRIWDVNSGDEIRSLDYRDSGLSSIDVDAENGELVAAGRRGMRTWTIDGIGKLAPDAVGLEGDEQGTAGRAGVTGAASDPSGSTLLVVENGTGRLINRVSDAPAPSPPFGAQVLRVAFSPTGSAVVGIAVDGTARLRAVRASGESTDAPEMIGSERVLRAPGQIVSAGFSSDGATVVTASSDGIARLWRATDGRLLRALPSAGVPLTDAQLSPGGRLVATAGRDGMARVLSRRGEPVAAVRTGRVPVSAIAFAAGGRMLITAAADGQVRIWAKAAPFRPVAARKCEADAYYSPAGRGGAVAGDGRVYAASVRCPAAEGSAVRAPEAGVVAAGRDAAGERRVQLTTPDGRRWNFAPVALRHGLARGSEVPAGASIGSVVRQAGASRPGIRIELLERARGGERLANLWNPLLFLDATAAPARAEYPGDSAPKNLTARWMGRTAEAAGLPPEVPVMAALVESGLHNLSFGDRDSVGFFGMRQSIWNRGPYAGFLDKPELQLSWFINYAQSERARRLAAGRRDPAEHPALYGEWIADVVQPPEQFRGRFQLTRDEARQLLGLAGARRFRPGRVPEAAAPAAAAAAPVDAGAVPADAAPVPAGAAVAAPAVAEATP